MKEGYATEDGDRRPPVVLRWNGQKRGLLCPRNEYPAILALGRRGPWTLGPLASSPFTDHCFRISDRDSFSVLIADFFCAEFFRVGISWPIKSGGKYAQLQKERIILSGAHVASLLDL